MNATSDDRPPLWISKLLSRFLDPKVQESSLGDLEEKYKLPDGGTSRWRASLLYSYERNWFPENGGRKEARQR